MKLNEDHNKIVSITRQIGSPKDAVRENEISYNSKFVSIVLVILFFTLLYMHILLLSLAFNINIGMSKDDKMATCYGTFF